MYCFKRACVASGVSVSVIGASEASPFLVMNVAILSVCVCECVCVCVCVCGVCVCVCVCVSWTGTIFVFYTHDPLPTFT